MGTFDDLQIGDSFETPSVALDDDLAQTLIVRGGYTHPLFTDPGFAAASPFGKRPFPGQAVLLLMGGLVEQSGRFDDTVIALIGFEQVRFRAPAFVGDTLTVTVAVADKQPGQGRGLLVMDWTASTGKPIVDARARMLFRTG